MTASLILAAGKGTRMKSDVPKVLHPVAGRPMISWVLDAAARAGSDDRILVYGHGADQVIDYLGESHPDVRTALQQRLDGTASAVMAARALLESRQGDVLILCGDTPLLDADLLRSFMDAHCQSQATLSVLSAHLDDPAAYGRVLRDERGRFCGIVEARDASAEQLAIGEINAGVYLVDCQFLLQALDQVDNRNAQGEYYLTDIVPMALERGLGVQALDMADADSILGVNSRADLARVSRVAYQRTARRLMDAGVSFIDPQNVYIEADVQVGADSLIYPGVCLEGSTRIGRNCLIRSNCTVVDSELGDDCELRDGSFVQGARLENRVSVGPWAHLRRGTLLEDDVKIGNFVETKKARVGKGSKASHLSYLGDAELGTGVNIGCGTITCNYDGFGKHRTIIEDDVFVGSDTQLVAPVRLGAGTMVAAGTTVTRDVPANALVISRVEQKTVDNWAQRFRQRKRKEMNIDEQSRTDSASD